MIKTPTTFIVGAGASSDYGLPLGASLKARAKSLLKPGQQVYLALMGCGFDSGDLNKFVEALARHPGASIDEYLYNRPDRSIDQEIGRALIATLMALAFQEAAKNSYDRCA